MVKVKNGTVIYAAHPTGHIEPDVHVKYVEKEIDLDNVPLNGGVLLKTIAVSSDPYMLYRMRDPSIQMFTPAIPLGSPCVHPALYCSRISNSNVALISVDNNGVAKVLRSENPNFKPGEYVLGYLGI
jgi:NADPH-dependent curcumin reductase CurA